MRVLNQTGVDIPGVAMLRAPGAKLFARDGMLSLLPVSDSLRD